MRLPRQDTPLSLPAERPSEGIARDEALLRVRRVGICGTDLHIFQGHLDHRVPRGGVIGHETFGEVVEAPGPSGFTRGDRVVVEPVVCCGSCRACRMGASYLCYELKVLGVDLPGGMREYWAVSTSRLLRVPDSISDDHAALIEPLAVAVHDVNRADVKRDDAVLVFGGGPIGTLIALVARHRGARVAVAELNPFRLDILESFGLERVGPGTDVVKWTDQWTDGTGVDIAFEVTGNPVAALALLEATVRVTRLPMAVDRLREVAESFLHDVEAALEEHPELAEQLKEMLEAEEDDEDNDEDAFDFQSRARRRGPDPDRPPPDAPPGLPSGKALVDAVENYLRQRRGDDPPDGPPSGPAV